MSERVSNYFLQCEDWKRRFLLMDIQKLIHLLPGLTEKCGFLTLRYFGENVGVNLSTGDITNLDFPDRVLSHTDKMNIYTLFWYVKPGAALTGEWMPFAELKDASPFANAFRRGDIEPFSHAFSGKLDKLAIACDNLGGKRLGTSDLGFELNAFDCMPLRFLFWDGDDEFPAQGNILFDKSATDFIHVESTVTIASCAIARIAQAAGVETGSAFLNDR